jgi:hypothetical protein
VILYRCYRMYYRNYSAGLEPASRRARPKESREGILLCDQGFPLCLCVYRFQPDRLGPTTHRALDGPEIPGRILAGGDLIARRHA